MPIWNLAHRYHKAALLLANRHYNRQKHDTPQFVPPGACVVLLSDDARALWVSSAPKFVQHAWPDAWINTLFRNESNYLSSALITEAVSATLWVWKEAPAGGFISFVKPTAIRSTNPGYCYLCAGWQRIDRTMKGLYVMHLPVPRFPAPEPPGGAQAVLI